MTGPVEHRDYPARPPLRHRLFNLAADLLLTAAIVVLAYFVADGLASVAV